VVFPSDFEIDNIRKNIKKMVSDKKIEIKSASYFKKNDFDSLLI
jgi:hypothetical protein